MAHHQLRCIVVPNPAAGQAPAQGFLQNDAHRERLGAENPTISLAHRAVIERCWNLSATTNTLEGTMEYESYTESFHYPASTVC